MAEGVEFVIPRLAEGETKFAMQFERVRTGRLHRVADPILRDNDVSDRVGLRVVDAEVRSVHPAAAVGAESGILGDFVAQVLPAAKGRGESGAGSPRTLPVILRALRTTKHGLVI